MSFLRYKLFFLLFVSMGACSAVAAENVQPPVEAPAPAKKTKPPVKARADKTKAKTTTTPTKPPTSEGNMRDPIFSDPGVPVMSSAKSPKPEAALPSTAKGAVGVPDSGLSLGLKWHATNDVNDPYDGTARHTSGDDGPGNAFLGGIKLGF